MRNTPSFNLQEENPTPIAFYFYEQKKKVMQS